MKKQIWFTLTIVLISSVAMAGIPGLEQAYTRHLGKTRAMIESQNLIQNTQPKTCSQQTLDIRADGKIEITVAFGYMDVSGGQDIKDSASQMYGNGDVLDQDALHAMESVLKSSCSGNKYRACGFSGRNGVLTKRIRDRWTNQRLQVQINLVSASYSASDAANKSQYKSNQTSKTATARSTFLSGLQNKDAVIYLGHARSGGGPDFAPPVLYANGKVNYSHYKQQKEGIRSMLGALQGASEPASIIGVLACKSTGLFSGSIKSKAPDSALVTAGDLFDYNDILPTGYAMIEAIVSQRCGAEFNEVVKVQPGSRRFLSVFY